MSNAFLFDIWALKDHQGLNRARSRAILFERNMGLFTHPSESEFRKVLIAVLSDFQRLNRARFHTIIYLSERNMGDLLTHPSESEFRKALIAVLSNILSEIISRRM